MGDDAALLDPVGVANGRENVVEPHVRIPHREAQARLVGMQAAEDVDVALVEDDLDRAPADASAAHPHERAEPQRQGVDVERRWNRIVASTL